MQSYDVGIWLSVLVPFRIQVVLLTLQRDKASCMPSQALMHDSIIIFDAVAPAKLSSRPCSPGGKPIHMSNTMKADRLCRAQVS